MSHRSFCFFSLFVLVFLTLPAVAQINGPLALRFGSAGAEQMRDVCVDSTGAYIMAFQFENAVSFPGGTNPSQTLTSNGLRDSGLVQYDFIGNLQWALSWGNAEEDETPVAIACAPDGSTYVTGRFRTPFDANPRFGETIITSNGDADVYLIKFDPSGNFLWVRTFGGTLEDEPAAISIDRDGNLLLTMLYQGTLDANPNPNAIAFHQSAGGKDILFIKLTPAGNYVYSRSIGGLMDDGVDGVSTAFDTANNLVVAGTFRGTADLDPGPAPAEFTSAGASDIFLARYSPSGSLVTARQILGAGPVRITSRSLALDDQDNVYLTGTFSGDMDVDTTIVTRLLSSRQSTQDAFVVSYNRNDQHRWSFALGGLGNETGAAISVDRNGTLAVSGSYQGTMDLDPGAPVFSILAGGSGGATDGFAAKYRTSDGSFVLGFGFGASLSGTANNTVVNAVGLDTMGSLVLAGTFFGSTVDFDPTPGATTLSSAGEGDLFLAVYDWQGNLRLPTLELEKPVLRANTNGASFAAGGVVPGSLYTLFGLNITTRTPGITTPDVPRSLPIPTKLCNTEIVFTDPLTTLQYKAPILFCSQFQINYQVPRDLPVGRFVRAEVIVDDVASNPLELLVKSDDVGIFMEDFATKLGAMVFAFGQRRGQKMTFNNTITACDILEVYVTGLGNVTGGLPPDGTPAGGVRPTPSEAKIVIYDDGTKGFIPIGARFVELRRDAGFIQYSGLTPQFVGLYQINMEWPNPQASPSPFIPPLFQGDYPAYIEFNGRRSQQFILPIRYDASNPSPCRVQ
jgi:uncharacterized protein (TIGR03437 family)